MEFHFTLNSKLIVVFTATLVIVSFAVNKISERVRMKKRLKEKSKDRKNLLKLPPCFLSVPLIGSMPFLPPFSKMHEYFSNNFDKYGPVVGIYFANQYVIMLNGKEAIYDAFVKHGNDFAGRPKFKFDEFLKKTRKGIIVHQYDDDFKYYHKLTVNILRKFGFGSKIMERKIHFEIEMLIKELQSTNGNPTCPNLFLFQSVLNVVASLLLGKRFNEGDGDRDAIVDLIRRSFREFRELVVVNFFPFLRFIPKFKKALNRGKELKRDIYKLMDCFIDKCLENEDENNFIFEFIKENSRKHEGKDELINFYSDIGKINSESHLNLNKFPLDINSNPDQELIPATYKCENISDGTSKYFPYDREQLILTLNDLFKAGTETTVSTLEWAFIMMASNRDVQIKCFQEIDKIVGRDRLPTLSDKQQMPFVEATLYEIMRFKPVTPLGIPHCTDRDTEVLGFFIPAGTTVFSNLYSALKGPKFWEDPDVFKPQRFLSEDGNAVINKELVINFSMGKRSCTGEILARHEIFLIFTCILQRFHILPSTPSMSDEETNLNPTSESTPRISLPPLKSTKVEYTEVMDVSLKPTQYKLRFVER